MFNRPKNGEVLRGYTTDNLKNDRAKKLITSNFPPIKPNKRAAPRSNKIFITLDISRVKTNNFLLYRE
jgi:hypothetical protein